MIKTTYEEFKSSVSDRNFIILAQSVINQLDRYSGKDIHDTKKLMGILKRYLDAHKRRTINLEGTVKEVISGDIRWFDGEGVLKSMYDILSRGIYSV